MDIIDIDNNRCRLCIGTAQFGMDYGIQGFGQPKLSDALNILDTAIHNGVCAIDTAAAYGSAEDVVGIFNRNNFKKKVKIISKLAPDVLNNVHKDDYNTVIQKNIQQSIRRLNTDYLDYYLLHNPSYMYNANIIEALLKQKKEGLVKHIGVSVYTPDEAKDGMDRKFDVLQIPYSIFDQRMDEQGIIALAQQKKIEIHVRSIFTQGLLLMNESDIPLHIKQAVPFVRKFENLCNKFCLSRIQIAISFIRRKNGISYMIFGVDNKQQLIEIIEASKGVISEDILDETALQFSGIDENIIMPSKWRNNSV